MRKEHGSVFLPEAAGQFRPALHRLAEGGKPPGDDAVKDVAHTPDVEVGEILCQIEIDPAVPAGLPFDQEVVVADVAVTQPGLVKVPDASQAVQNPAQDAGKQSMEIFLMPQPDRVQIAEKIRPGNKIDHPDEIASRVACCDSLHKPGVAPDEIEDAGLLVGAPDTLRLQRAHADKEFLLEHQFEDVRSS